MPHEVRARAAVAHAPGQPLRIETVDVRAPDAGEVRVRVRACGICASDLHVWRTGEGISFPAILGHEAAGVVEAVGPEVSRVRPGEAVVLSWIPSCGECRACRSGRTHLCAAMRTNADDGSLILEGRTLGRYMGVSGLCERVVTRERCVVPLPGGLSPETACAIGCGVTTGFGAVTLTGAARSGESVAVFGCGGVGLAAIQGARIAGASRIIAVDPNRERLALASRLGATDTLSPEDVDPISAIRERTRGGVDLAIEAAGSGAVARDAFDTIASGGRAVVVGLTRFSEEISVPMASLLLDKSLHGCIHGSADPARDFPKLFDLALRGELALDVLMGPDFPLTSVNDALEALATGRAIRPRVVFPEGMSTAETAHPRQGDDAGS